MTNPNNKEMLSNKTSTSQSTNIENAETTSASPTTNYTLNNSNIQAVDTNSNITKQYAEEDIEKILNIKSLLDTKTKLNFYDGKFLKYKDVTDYIIKRFHIIKLHEELHIFTNGIYVHNMNIIECLIRYVLPKAKSADIKVVINELYFRAPSKLESSYKYVAFANRILNVENFEDFEFNADTYIIPSRINTVYSKDILETDSSNVEFVNTYFDNLSCGNKELANLYLEILGYSMVRSHKFQLAFLLKGNANNGKSVFLKVLEHLTGKYCSHLNLQQLSNIKSLGDLCNCTANIIDDTSQPKKIDLEQIQSIISGATISVPQKDMDNFRFEPYCTLLLATTNMLEFKDFNKSLTRRFVVVPFNANFDNNRNDDIEEKICKQQNLSVIAVMAFNAFSKVLADGHFHIPEFVIDDTRAYFYTSNPIMEFAELYPIKRLIIKGEYIAKYEQWCEHNGRDKVDRAVFGKKILTLGYKPGEPSFDGVRNDYYLAPDFNVNDFRAEYEQYKNSLDNPNKAMKILDYISYLNKQDGL